MHIHGGSWMGATMTPEGQDNLKGQASLGCKRNSLLLGGRHGRIRGRQADRRGAGTEDVFLPALRGNLVAVTQVSENGEKVAKSIELITKP
jgi:hypothetical protein